MVVLNGVDLFSGIGGLSLALAPWVKPIAYCENDRYAQAVLLSRVQSGEIANAPIWDDIRTFPQIKADIVYGGFPCQDISIAGAGDGLAGQRSGLVFEMLRVVEGSGATFVFMENVPAIRYRGAERVVKELASIGYDCRWGVVSASEVGAPHKRDRWFLLAYSDRKRLPLARRDEIAPNLDSRDEPEFLVQADIWSESARDSARVDDGIPPRTYRIKSCGNAVVPIQAREAFKRLAGIK